MKRYIRVLDKFSDPDYEKRKYKTLNPISALFLEFNSLNKSYFFLRVPPKLCSKCPDFPRKCKIIIHIHTSALRSTTCFHRNKTIDINSRYLRITTVFQVMLISCRTRLYCYEFRIKLQQILRGGYYTSFVKALLWHTTFTGHGSRIDTKIYTKRSSKSI